MIRKDWLDKLGLDIPETYDEMHDVLLAFKNELGAEAPMTLNYAATGINNGFVQGYGIYGLVADAAQSEPFYQEDGIILRQSLFIYSHPSLVCRTGGRLGTR